MPILQRTESAVEGRPKGVHFVTDANAAPADPDPAFEEDEPRQRGIWEGDFFAGIPVEPIERSRIVEISDPLYGLNLNFIRTVEEDD